MDSYLTSEPVTLHSIYDIEQLRAWYPELKHVCLSFFREEKLLNDYIQAICTAFVLESLEIRGTSFKLTELPQSLWTSQLKALSIVLEETHTSKKLELNVPNDFDNHLEILVLGIPCVYVHKRLFNTPTLKKVRLDFVMGQEYLHNALNLNYLEIVGSTQEPTWCGLPLETLSIRSCIELPPLKLLPQLKTLTVEGQRFELKNDWDALQNLETLSLTFLDTKLNARAKSMKFKNLRQLKNLTIQNTNLTIESCQWGELLALESVRFKGWRSTLLPDVLFKSSVLKKIEIQQCAHLISLPSHLFEQESLESLKIESCPVLQVSRYWAISHLKNLQYDKSRYWRADLMPFLQSIEADPLERLAFGCAIIENLKNIEPNDLLGIKQGLLSLARVKNLALKNFLLENTYFFNPEQVPKSFPNEPQSIHILGSTHKFKLDYKTKLIELGYTYHHKLQPDTALIVLAGHGTIPERFFEYPHLFFKEPELEKHLQTIKPDFLQDLDAPDWRHLQQMIWGGNPDTDILVLTLVRAGGIPAILIPELVMMTKMMEVPEPVRQGLRKLLKAKGDDATLQILSASGTPDSYNGNDIFAYYKRKSPHFDIPSMSVCYDMRTKKRVRTFFTFTESERHPRRQEIFELFCTQLSYADFNNMGLFSYWFTEAELTYLLSDVRAVGRLESLSVSCFSKEIPEILFKHITLKDLTLRWQGKELPTEIGQLTELTDLDLRPASIKTIPVSFLNLQKLNNLYFRGTYYNYHTLYLPPVFADWIGRFSHCNNYWKAL